MHLSSLQNYVKVQDIVDVSLCSDVYHLCKNRQFECQRGYDFVAFLNLRKSAYPVTVRHNENTRVSYLIHRLSKYLTNPMDTDFTKQWITSMIQMCKIDPVHYEKHYMDPEPVKNKRDGSRSRPVSKPNTRFKEKLDAVLDRFEQP